LPVAVGGFLFNSCLNPITGEYEIPPFAISINPATEGVLIFKNATTSEKLTKVWVDPVAPSEFYETSVGVNSSYVVTETAPNGKEIPKRFDSGNLYFSVEGSAQPVYTVAAFGVTYVTISEYIEAGVGTTVINVDVVSPNGPLTVQLEGGNFTIKLDDDQYVAIDNYIKQQLIAPILVHNATSSAEPILVKLDAVAYGTKEVEIRQGEYKTISLSNFDQADANHTVTAVVAGQQSGSTYVNVWRKDPARSYEEHVNAVRITDDLFSGSIANKNITYHITANGGWGNNSSPDYDTMKLTFTFSSELDYTPDIQKTSSSSTFNILPPGLKPTADPRTFTMDVETTWENTRVEFKAASPGIDPSIHKVAVFKGYNQDPSLNGSVTGALHSFNVRYTTDDTYTMTLTSKGWTYHSAGQGQFSNLEAFKAKAAIPRNQEVTVRCFWIYVDGTYDINGDRVVTAEYRLDDYTYFLRDYISGANYIKLERNPGGVGYKFKVGNKTAPAYAYDTDNGVGKPWPYKLGTVAASYGEDYNTSIRNNNNTQVHGLYMIASAQGVHDIRVPVYIFDGTYSTPTTAPITKLTPVPLSGDSVYVGGQTNYYFPIHGVGISTDVLIKYGLQFDLWVQQ
jgi:hypothetical protein